MHTPAADALVKTHVENLLQQDAQIDTILLACTHYPLLENIIRRHLPPQIRLMSQGAIVAASLTDYLRRHPEIETNCSKGGTHRFFTSGSITDFEAHTTAFFGRPVRAEHVDVV